VVVIQSFWRNYQDACKAENVQVMPREHFPDRSIDGILSRIRNEQPAVFARLEDMRSKIWPTDHKGMLDAGLTLIFTSHPTASSWYHSQTTRIWYHPSFRPFMDVQEQQALRNTFVFAKVVYDEPEIDEVLHVISESTYQHLKHQHTSGNWKGLSNRQQRDLFKQAVADGVLGGQKLEFETYAELMRVQLDKLERVAVDCDAIPFGHDNITTADGGKTGMYRAMHGKTFYLGPKQWLAHAGTNWTFLTTEKLVTDVIEKLYQKLRKSLIPLRLDQMPDIYPIKVPVFIDTRASADRPGVPKVSAIAREIMNSNGNAVVVSDGVDENIGAMSFQRMKGRNDLADKDVYIILTSLAVEVYARLNVIGQWLGIPDIVGLHYQGLINQAVGRNTGFRQRDGTKTVVICSHRLWDPVISKLNLSHPRVLLYKVAQRPW
jgi:hypothetical protein